MVLSLADLLVQPNPRRRPMPLHRGWRHAQNISSLFDGKPSEKSKLDDSALLRVEFGQAIEGIIERDQIHALALVEGECIVESQPGPSMSLGCLLAARVLDENLPHQLRAHRIEMRTILEQHWFLFRQSKIGLVHESRALQRVPGMFFSKLVVR
jgi:hypothetical protein